MDSAEARIAAAEQKLRDADARYRNVQRQVVHLAQWGRDEQSELAAFGIPTIAMSSGPCNGSGIPITLHCTDSIYFPATPITLNWDSSNSWWSGCTSVNVPAIAGCAAVNGVALAYILRANTLDFKFAYKEISGLNSCAVADTCNDLMANLNAGAPYALSAATANFSITCSPFNASYQVILSQNIWSGAPTINIYQ